MRVNTVVWADLSVLYVYLVGLQGTPLWSSRCRNWFICTCVCVFLYIHMCVSVHFCGGQSCLMQLLYTWFVCVCTRTCMWVQRSHSSIDFNCSLFYFLKHNLSLAWGSQTQLERLTSESLDWPVSPIAGITAGITVLWGLRNELIASTSLILPSSQPCLLYLAVRYLAASWLAILMKGLSL